MLKSEKEIDIKYDHSLTFSIYRTSKEINGTSEAYVDYSLWEYFAVTRFENPPKKKLMAVAVANVNPEVGSFSMKQVCSSKELIEAITSLIEFPASNKASISVAKLKDILLVVEDFSKEITSPFY